MENDRDMLITREHAVAAAQNAVRNQGYAVALHGSRVRDIDLLAVPWTEDTPHSPLRVAEMIAAAIPGAIIGKPEKRPLSRPLLTRKRGGSCCGAQRECS